MIKSAAIIYKGKLYTGRTHSKIIVDNPQINLLASEQGFMTDDDKFVTREEAAKIAYECGQISKPTHRLISDDLYK